MNKRQNKFTNFCDEIWYDIKPIINHTIVSLALILPAIFSYFIINPFLLEPQHSIAFVLETIFFVCALSLNTFLAIAIIYKRVRKKLSNDEDQNDDPTSDTNQNDGNSEILTSQVNETKKINPLSANAEEIEEKNNSKEPEKVANRKSENG